jgi:hypothetical protein
MRGPGDLTEPWQVQGEPSLPGEGLEARPTLEGREEGRRVWTTPHLAEDVACARCGWCCSSSQGHSGSAGADLVAVSRPPAAGVLEAPRKSLQGRWTQQRGRCGTTLPLALGTLYMVSLDPSSHFYLSRYAAHSPVSPKMLVPHPGLCSCRSFPGCCSFMPSC